MQSRHLVYGGLQLILNDLFLLKPGSHSHDFTGDHWRPDSRGVVAGWSAARLSIVAGVVVGGLLWSPGLS